MQSPPRSSAAVLLAALLLGAAADYLFYGRWVGISAPLFIALGLVALAWLGASQKRPATRANMWLGGAALLFAGFMAWRTEPLLVVLDGFAIIGLLLLLTAYYRGPAILRATVPEATLDLIKASWGTGVSPLVAGVSSLRAIPARPGQWRAAMPILRGVVLAVPVLLVFGGLLVSADTVFASYIDQLLSFDIPLDLESLIGHSFVVLFVAWFCAGGLLTALSSVPRTSSEPFPADGDTTQLSMPSEPWRFLGAIEALTVLVLVDLLFGGFMLVQGTYFFGGLDTLNRTGTTYADYARRGFFELVTVACLSLTMLWLMALITKRDSSRQWRAFKGANVAMVVLVVGMLVSAFQRMWLYEEAYGFTRLRVYTHSFMIWLAVVLVLFLVALLRDRAKLFVFGGIATALVYLALLNIASPDALIVRANIARYQAGGELDAYYLSTLSSDAIPAIVASLDTLDSASQATFRDAFEWQQENLSTHLAEQGWPAWNIGRARALAAMERALGQP